MEECRKRAVALGFFDGVHLGHQALLRRTAERAEMLGLSPALLTFDRSPREFVTGTPVPLLTTVQERSRTARALFPGMEVITVPFDRAMMTMPWEDFVVMLSEVYRARWLVAATETAALRLFSGRRRRSWDWGARLFPLSGWRG